MNERKSIRSMAFDKMTFAYENQPATFERVSFQMPTKHAVWVRSPGGGGKSTLLRILAGLLYPQSGRYLINGEPTDEMSFTDFLAYRMSMGYGFDLGGLINNKTVYENLILPLAYHKLVPEAEAEERIHDTLRVFGLTAVRDLRPFAVSGSQRKLTCVTRAFVHSPEVVFLDDPLIGLKEENTRDLIAYIQKGFQDRGLRQIIFTGENSLLARHFDAEELLISTDSFHMKAVA